MTDLKDILGSAEMAAVVQAIDALRRRYGATPSATEGGTSSHAEHLWPVALIRVGRFKPEVILKILLDGNDYYPGYKEVLTAGFGGWLIAPRVVEIREALAIQATAMHMESAEIRAGFDDPFTVQKDIAARYLFTGTEFLSEIYDCFGGNRALADAPSFESLWNAFDSVEKTINTTVRAVGYLHHAVDRFTQRTRRFVPSLNKAVAILDLLKETMSAETYKERYVSRSLLHERWSQNKQTLALLYAASTIKINRKTLLQLILEGFLSHDKHSQYFAAWVGRARYVSSHIFARMEKDPDLRRKTSRLLGEGDVIEFAPSDLTRDEAASFEKIFKIYINN